MPETIQLDTQRFNDPRRATIAAALLEVVTHASATGPVPLMAAIRQELKPTIDAVLAAIDGEAAAGQAR